MQKVVGQTVHSYNYTGLWSQMLCSLFSFLFGNAYYSTYFYSTKCVENIVPLRMFISLCVVVAQLFIMVKHQATLLFNVENT